MNRTEFNAALIKLGFPTAHPLTGEMSLGQTEFADTIGKSVRMVRRWAAGTHPVPIEIGMLLNLMIKHKVKPGKLQP